MIKEKILLTIIWILIGITIWFTISGCALLQRGIFKSKPESVVPETSKAQLWQTIKGMTPNWLAIPVIALGAVAMFNGVVKLGMSCIIFGSVNLFMALATSRFGFWMAVCGLVGSCAAIAASILTKNKALRDIVYNVQDLKKAGWMPIDAKKILTKQAESTKKIVQKIKAKAKLRGEI